MTKQFLLICNDETRISLGNAIKGLEFLEVQGLNLNNENKFNLLVAPVIPPVNPAFIEPPKTTCGKPETGIPVTNEVVYT